MSVLQPDYYPPGINTYCPAMQYASDVDFGKANVWSLGTPSAPDADGITTAILLNSLSVQKVADFVPGSGGVGRVADSPFGRTISITPSGAPGADTVVHVSSEDYLGQPVKEAITLPSAGTVAVLGVKAHYRITKVEVVSAASNAVTGTLGWDDKYGLPYKTDQLVGGTAGALVAAVLTDPATAITGDPRGLFDPTAPADGATEFVVYGRVNSDVNASGNGGLHGIAHYHA